MWKKGDKGDLAFVMSSARNQILSESVMHVSVYNQDNSDVFSFFPKCSSD